MFHEHPHFYNAIIYGRIGRDTMTIESKKISKDYIEEFLNTGVSVAKIKADPKKPIDNWFSRLTIWITFVTVWIVAVLGVLGFFGYCIVTKSAPVTFYILGAALLILFGMLIILLMKNVKLLKMLKSKRKEYMTSERNVVYKISEEEFEYEDIGKQKISFAWPEVDFILIREKGSYVIPKDTSKMAFIGVPNENGKTLKDYLVEQKINVKIIKSK